MARIRTIDTDGLFFDGELTNNLTATDFLIYIRLWGIGEDWGGFEWSPENIKLQLGGLKIPISRVEDCLKKLVKMGKIIPYKKDGKLIGWLKNFQTHQKLKKPSLPRLPLPDWITYEQKEYPGGQKYAEYKIIKNKIPVDYSYPTSNTETKRNETKRKDYESDEPEGSPTFTTLIKNYFISAYKKKFNEEPAIDFGKDLKVVKKAQSLFKDINNAYKLIDIFLDSKKGDELGLTLAICFSTHTINAFKSGKLRKVCPRSVAI